MIKLGLTFSESRQNWYFDLFEFQALFDDSSHLEDVLTNDMYYTIRNGTDAVKMICINIFRLEAFKAYYDVSSIKLFRKSFKGRINVSGSLYVNKKELLFSVSEFDSLSTDSVFGICSILQLRGANLINISILQSERFKKKYNAQITIIYI